MISYDAHRDGDDSSPVVRTASFDPATEDPIPVIGELLGAELEADPAHLFPPDRVDHRLRSPRLVAGRRATPTGAGPGQLQVRELPDRSRQPGLDPPAIGRSPFDVVGAPERCRRPGRSTRFGHRVSGSPERRPWLRQVGATSGDSTGEHRFSAGVGRPVGTPALLVRRYVTVRRRDSQLHSRTYR